MPANGITVCRLYRILWRRLPRARSAEQIIHADSRTILWVLEWVPVGVGIQVKVILRKIGNGNVHFLSVMKKENNQTSTKKPRP